MSSTAGSAGNGIHYSVVNVTPKMAEEMLGHNLRNRRVSQKRVDEFAAIIKRGDFVLTGDPIRFNRDGVLLDGQHRLLAVIEANKGVQLFVLRNVPNEIQDVIDTGMKRTLAHVLQIRGYSFAAELAAAVNSLAAFRKYGRFDMRGEAKVGHTELLNILHRNKGLEESVRTVKRLRETSSLRLRSQMATLHYVISERFDSEEADEFFDHLVDFSYGSSKHDPIALLRKRTIEIQQKKHGSVSPRLEMALTIKAFNAWMRGEELENLRWRTGGKAPEAYPELIKGDEVA